MAQFLKAKFLSEALKWKANPRYASDQFFAGLRYDPYIYAQARLTFPEYNKRFPTPANQAFVENFARDLANPTRNQELLKIINPEALIPELETANREFEASARLEQQVVAEVSGQPLAQPFSLVTPTPVILRPAPPVAIKIEQPTETPATTPAQPQPKVGRPPIQVPRIPPTLANTIRNLSSGAGVFFQQNVGKYITAGRVATVVSGGIGAITGGALTNGSAIGMLGGGGLGAIAPSWIRSGEGTKFLGRVGNGAINAGVNISNQAASGIPKLPGSPGKRKLIWVFLGLFILTAFSLAFTSQSPGPIPQPAPGGGDCPDTSGNTNPATCRYLNPSINLFDTNLSQLAIDSYVNKYSPIFINASKGDLNEFKKRTDYIVNNAKSVGLNPAMFLGYWKTESMFSTSTNTTRDMGCAGGDDFYNQVDCALGINAFTNPNTNPIANCAKSKDANSAACQALKGIRAKAYDKTHPISYPIATFDNFAEAYGPYDDLTGGQPTNCTHTYNELIDMAKELGACQAAPPGGSDFASQLVDKIKKSDACTYNGNAGIVYRFNAESCMASVNPPQLTAQTIIGSAQIYTFLQCVGFVQSVANDLIGVRGNAIDYSRQSIRGYRFIQRQTGDIKIGDLSVWNIGDNGHIAYVVGVQNDGGFRVAEANNCYPDCGKVGLHDEFTSDPTLVGWLRKEGI